MVDVEPPAPGAGELLVEVRATTVNRTDCGYRSGTPFVIRAFSGLRRPRATILGTELAGVIASLGAGVSSFAVGDRVFGYCEGTFGAHAELMTIPADRHVARIPDGFTFTAVAPATEGWHYALACVRAAGIEPGQDVLVYGATGAIGSAAVQVLASRDVNVTAVCDRDHVALVEGLGASPVIDREMWDAAADGGEWGLGDFDVVFDAVGKSTFGRCRPILRPRGVYMVTDLGPWWQNPLLALVTRVGRGRRVMLAAPREDPRMMEEVTSMLTAGTFRPVIDRTYPLDRIVEAYRYVETGQKIGNVVIDVRGDDETSVAG